MTTITSKFTKERLIDWAVVAVAERGARFKGCPGVSRSCGEFKIS